MVSPDRTILITSTSRALTTTEKMAQGDGRLDAGQLLTLARRMSRDLVAFDMDRAAKEMGTIVSAVMFGAIAATGVLPFSREQFEDVLRKSGISVDASLRGFGRAFSQTSAREEQTPQATGVADADDAVDCFPIEVRD